MNHSAPAQACPTTLSALARAIETDRIYFEQGAERMDLCGATLAWMPGLTRSAAAAVIHRVDPAAIVQGGTAWLAHAEGAIAATGAALSRIYLDEWNEQATDVLRRTGYVDREELVFFDALPEPSIDLVLRPVATEADWAEKLRFHEAADETPDGHDNLAADWVELERRKCGAGMETFLAELNGEVVGAVGAIWFDDFVRTKNIIVAPNRRRDGIGRAMLGCIGALGRRRGISEQCLLAVRGEQGEQLYRAIGMTMIGTQIEWSKPIAGGAR